MASHSLMLDDLKPALMTTVNIVTLKAFAFISCSLRKLWQQDYG